jgi:ankyrin repeat protein
LELEKVYRIRTFEHTIAADQKYLKEASMRLEVRTAEMMATLATNRPSSISALTRVMEVLHLPRGLTTPPALDAGSRSAAIMSTPKVVDLLLAAGSLPSAIVVLEKFLHTLREEIDESESRGNGSQAEPHVINMLRETFALYFSLKKRLCLRCVHRSRESLDRPAEDGDGPKSSLGIAASIAHDGCNLLPSFEDPSLLETAIRHDCLPRTRARDIFKRNILHLALYHGLCMTDGLRGLISALDLVEINERDIFGRTPLQIAAIKGYGDVIQSLLAAGASPHNPDNNGWLPLHYACVAGDEEIINMLLDAPDTRDAMNHRPLVLGFAAIMGNHNLVRLLLRAGAEPNRAGDKRWTALHHAAANGRLSVVKELLDWKGNLVDADKKDSGSRTPLWLAAAHGHEDVVLALLLRDDVNQQAADKDGVTPKQVAAAKGYTRIVDMMDAGSILHGPVLKMLYEPSLGPVHAGKLVSRENAVQARPSAVDVSPDGRLLA